MARTVLSRVLRAGLVMVGIGALALQGGAAWGAWWLVDNQRSLKDQVVAQQFGSPPEIQSLVSQAGMSERGSLYFRTSLPRIVPSYEFGRYCTRSEPGIGVLGCFTLRDERIYLYDVTDERLTSIEPVVAAHEMLHAAWARLTAEEQDALAILLEEGFADLGPDHRLVERIASYEASDPRSRIPELYAILGTEVSPLPESLEAHYETLFDDRERVVALAEEIYLVFDSIQAELERLSTELQSRSAEIEGLRFTYEEESGALTGDILRFNEKASIPGAFPSKSEFEAARSALVERQNRLENMRVSLQTKIAEYNELLEELVTLNDEVSELNQGINVTLREQVELSSPATGIED